MNELSRFDLKKFSYGNLKIAITVAIFIVKRKIRATFHLTNIDQTALIKVTLEKNAQCLNASG